MRPWPHKRCKNKVCPKSHGMATRLLAVAPASSEVPEARAVALVTRPPLRLPKRAETLQPTPSSPKNPTAATDENDRDLQTPVTLRWCGAHEPGCQCAQFPECSSLCVKTIACLGEGRCTKSQVRLILRDSRNTKAERLKISQCL